MHQMIETFFTPGSLAPAATPGLSLAAFHTPQAELRPFPALANLAAPTPSPSGALPTTPTFQASRKPAGAFSAGFGAASDSHMSPLAQGLSLSVGPPADYSTPELKRGSQAGPRAAVPAARTAAALALKPQQATDSPSKLADAAEKVGPSPCLLTVLVLDDSPRSGAIVPVTTATPCIVRKLACLDPFAICTLVPVRSRPPMHDAASLAARFSGLRTLTGTPEEPQLGRQSHASEHTHGWGGQRSWQQAGLQHLHCRLHPKPAGNC